MIIWGSKTRFSKTDEGVFYCPSEQGDRPYERKTAKQWFTLYFIPVFPMSDRGEVVECQTCKNQFNPGVLELTTTHALTTNLSAAMRHAVVAIVLADGNGADNEKEAAVAVMRRYDAGYTVDNLNEDLQNLDPQGAYPYLLDCAGSLDQFGKETLIAQLGYIAEIDAPMGPTEAAVITATGQTLSMTPAHIDGLINRVVDPTHRTN